MVNQSLETYLTYYTEILYQDNEDLAKDLDVMFKKALPDKQWAFIITSGYTQLATTGINFWQSEFNMPKPGSNKTIFFIYQARDLDAGFVKGDQATYECLLKAFIFTETNLTKVMP